MIAVTALGKPAWLVPYGPNTDDEVQVGVRIPLESQRALTGRRTGRPQAQLPRYRLTWNRAMKMADYAAARAAAIQCQDQPILSPLWPAARSVAKAAVVDSDLIVAWTRNWASYAINPGTLDGYDFYAPVLWGRFAQPPRLTGRTSEYIRAEFSIVEDAPAGAAITAPVEADVTVETPDGYAAAVFPYTYDPGQEPSLNLPAYEVTRQQLGPGREQSTVFYPQVPEDALQPTFKFKTSAAAFGLVGWWTRRAGGADCFWVPSTQSLGRLSADMAIGATSIPFVALPPGDALDIGATLALVTTGKDAEFCRVSGHPITHFVPLSDAVAAAHPKAWTSVVAGLLVRHTDDELQINFRRSFDDWMATAKLSMREVAEEYNVIDGETRGVTVGRLAAEAYLFKVELDFAGATLSWHFTNWESGGVTPDTQAWEYRDCDYDKFIQSRDLQADNLTLKIRWWDGCPWAYWKAGKLAATGKLTLYTAEVADDGTWSAAVPFWTGALSTPSREGPMLSVKVLGANAAFDQQGPQQVMGPPCRKQLYGPRCGLALADWTFTGVVTAIAGNVVTVGTFLRVNTAPLPAGFGFKDWFALGWVQWPDALGKPARSEVVASTLLAGGHINLTLNRAPGFANGATINLVPGCDRQRITCWVYDAGTNPLGKFNNLNRFGGFDFMPAVSPNLIVPNSTSTPAKK